MHPHLIKLEPNEAALTAQARVKEWVREALHLPAGTLVTITEMQCPDPNCPLVETLVVVHDEGGLRRFQFGHPRAALTKMHVLQALQLPAS